MPMEEYHSLQGFTGPDSPPSTACLACFLLEVVCAMAEEKYLVCKGVCGSGHQPRPLCPASLKFNPGSVFAPACMLYLLQPIKVIPRM